MSYGHCFGRQQLLAKSIENFITPENNVSYHGPNLQSIKALLTLELRLSQYRQSGSMFSSSEPVAARSDYSCLGNALFVLARPTRPSCARALPQELCH